MSTKTGLPNDRLWTIDEVSYYLGIPKQTLHQWRTLDRGPAGRRVGRYLRYRPEDVRAWVAALAAELVGA
ncbi:helix-turn-helix transcriptional regulator [Arsenicicoccus bolidensis]|uniref:helix-turn-helix transcriptional regulator n=1 Tax=Arsenicicoccus bolidensis TaxID=229480 RepID=UPI0003FF6C78|nr:helix-turn-helix domain-containing protein [Arsenicicoccus bolidensis]